MTTPPTGLPESPAPARVYRYEMEAGPPEYVDTPAHPKMGWPKGVEYVRADLAPSVEERAGQPSAESAPEPRQPIETRRRTFAAVLASLLFVGGCPPSGERTETFWVMACGERTDTVVSAPYIGWTAVEYVTRDGKIVNAPRAACSSEMVTLPHYQTPALTHPDSETNRSQPARSHP